LFGRPDFVFPSAKVAIFVDGDFWHGHPENFKLPKTNREYWEAKILTNINRDIEVKLELEKLGWRVLRFWESGLVDEYAVAARIAFELK
jgi:DNA mismatch endonuclease (patch repair protein)